MTPHVAQQPLDDQSHEKEAELWILVIQVIHHLIGHFVELAVRLTDHSHGAHLLTGEESDLSDQLAGLDGVVDLL